MASLALTLEQIKNNPLQMLGRSMIHRVCEELGHHWRNRELDPATTIGLFIQQVIQGNTPCSEVRHIAGKRFSASAWCQARSRLPLAVYQTLVQRVYQIAGAEDNQEDYLWYGHRTFHWDGSSFSMPDTPELAERFGYPSEQKPGCGFPVAHLLVQFNARSGLLAEAIPGCWHRGDLADVPALLEQLQENDVVVGDDSFGTYVVLALLLQQKKHGLFPVHHARIVDFTPRRPFVSEREQPASGLPHSRWIKSLGQQDQLLEYFKPLQCPAWISQEDFDALPDSIVVRELRAEVALQQAGTIEVTMVTTLTDARRYVPAGLVGLRRSRWGVETNMAHLKTTMKMDILHCKTVDGILKELCIFVLVYNLVRVVMLEAARRQQVAVARISFADTLKWLRHVRSGEQLPPLVVNAHRPDRLEPRVKKRRPKPYSYMTHPRTELKKALKNQWRKA